MSETIKPNPKQRYTLVWATLNMKIGVTLHRETARTMDYVVSRIARFIESEDDEEVYNNFMDLLDPDTESRSGFPDVLMVLDHYTGDELTPQQYQQLAERVSFKVAGKL